MAINKLYSLEGLGKANKEVHSRLAETLDEFNTRFRTVRPITLYSPSFDDTQTREIVRKAYLFTKDMLPIGSFFVVGDWVEFESPVIQNNKNTIRSRCGVKLAKKLKAVYFAYYEGVTSVAKRCLDYAKNNVAGGVKDMLNLETVRSYDLHHSDLVEVISKLHSRAPMTSGEEKILQKVLTYRLTNQKLESEYVKHREKLENSKAYGHMIIDGEDHYYEADIKEGAVVKESLKFTKGIDMSTTQGAKLMLWLMSNEKKIDGDDYDAVAEIGTGYTRGHLGIYTRWAFVSNED